MKPLLRHTSHVSVITVQSRYKRHDVTPHNIRIQAAHVLATNKQRHVLVSCTCVSITPSEQAHLKLGRPANALVNFQA
jgi:hypothetical protein